MPSAGTLSVVPEVRRLAEGDIEAVADTLARAFDDDPVSTYLFPSDGRRARGLRRFFRLQLRRTYLVRGEPWVTDDLAAAALWMPPDAPKPAGSELWHQLPMIPILGHRLGAALQLVQMIEAKHPRQPHYYLGTLGTDPARQGTGLGSSVLGPPLARCDAEGIPAYLESSKEKNLAFYHRHGFEVTGEVALPNGKVRLWLMWREPRPPES